MIPLRRRAMMALEEKWNYIFYPADGLEEGYIAAVHLTAPIGSTITLEWDGSRGIVADFRNSNQEVGIINATSGTKATITTTGAGRTGIANVWNVAEGTTGGSFGFYGKYIKIRIE